MRDRSVGTLGIAIAVAVAWLHGLPAAAEGSSSCPLPLDGQVKAVYAFKPIASFVTKEPRCVNCHGGVNPHIDGIGADPADANAPASTTAHYEKIKRDRVTSPDGTPLAETQICRGCHNSMVRRTSDGEKSLWMTAASFHSFIGKDSPTLCKQFKSSTGSAEEFLGHLKDDNGGNNFAGTAFAGGCGLEPGGPFEENRIGCSKPSISHAAFQRLGRAWVDAMGGKFVGDESCGCEVDGLLGKFTSTDTGELGPMRNVTRVIGELVWTKKENSAAAADSAEAQSMLFTPSAGDITVEVEFENRGFEGKSACKGTGRRSFPVQSLTKGALRLMELEIADDGSYRVKLVIPDMPDPFPPWSFDSACIFPNATSNRQVEVRHTSVTLGEHRGIVEEKREIVGQLDTPIRRGPRTITGSWSFETQGTK